MSDEQLNTTAFVFLEELKAWKIVSFAHDECVAIRSETHEQAEYKDECDAQSFVKRRAARALLNFYHKEQAEAK